MISYNYYPDSQLKTLSDGTTTNTYAYDRLNRLTNSTSAVGNSLFDIHYSHDPVGNLTHSTVSANSQQLIANSYQYDSAERLTGISQSGSGILPLAFSCAYSPENGRVSSVTNLESGIVTSYAYDLMDRATNISHRTSAGSLIRSLGYQYDALGMITNRMTEAGGQTTEVSYEYDSINRLTSEALITDNGSQITGYAYDLAGNRTTVVDNGSTNTYTLGTGNRLSSWGTNGSALYDVAGNTTNLVSNDGTSLSLNWDERYRLKAVSSELLAVSYTYDVLGRKISRAEGSDEEHYIYNGNQIAADLDENGNLLRTYTWGPGIDNLLSMTVHPPQASGLQPQVYYPLKDHQNSVLAFTDASGSVVETYEYDAWGNVTVYDASGNELTSDLGLPTSGIGNRYMWQGREYDADTGLYYFRARWYSPETGRWLSKDPIGISGGLNQYAFCGNNPVNFTDPLGEQWLKPDDADYVMGLKGNPGPLGEGSPVLSWGEDNIANLHLTSKIHDGVVFILSDVLGYDFNKVNVPTMLPSYYAALAINMKNTMDDFKDWLNDLFEKSDCK